MHLAKERARAKVAAMTARERIELAFELGRRLERLREAQGGA
jgi:hypothetical protein